MKLSTIFVLYNPYGDLMGSARTRRQLSELVNVPLYSRNESGAWSVADPDADGSLDDVDNVNIAVAEGHTLQMRFVNLDTFVAPESLDILQSAKPSLKQLNLRLAQLEGRNEIANSTDCSDETLRLCCAYDIRFYGGAMYAEATYNHTIGDYKHVNEMVAHHGGNPSAAVRVAVVRAAIKFLEWQANLVGSDN